jgi:hypothetical protein
MTGSILATILIALSVLGWQIVPRTWSGRRLLAAAGLFALTTAVIAHLVGSPLEPVFAGLARISHGK